MTQKSKLNAKKAGNTLQNPQDCDTSMKTNFLKLKLHKSKLRIKPFCPKMSILGCIRGMTG